MARVFKIKKGDGTVEYVPGSSTCQTRDAALAQAGYSGSGYFVTTQFTEPGETAQEWIAKQGGTTAPTTTTPTPTATTPTAPTPTPSTTTTPTAPSGASTYYPAIPTPNIGQMLAPSLPPDYFLTGWGQAGRRPTEEVATTGAHSAAEWQDFADYMSFLREGGAEQGYPVPTDIRHYFANKNQWQAGNWSSDISPYEEGEEPVLPPVDVTPTPAEDEEAQYREAPMYSPTFAQWVQGRGDMSGALQQYVEGRYPSLKAEFQAEAGRLPYSETREGAIGEAESREQGWQAWLSERMPETRQEYWGQRPQERGERMYMYQPTTRSVNW